MRSVISDELKLRLMPVAVIFTDDKPAGALQFQEGQRGCVVSLLHAAAKGGQTAVFDRETTPCPGARSAWSWPTTWANPEGMANFLSVGGGPDGREGEGYLKTPEVARSSWGTWGPATSRIATGCSSRC